MTEQVVVQLVLRYKDTDCCADAKLFVDDLKHEFFHEETLGKIYELISSQATTIAEGEESFSPLSVNYQNGNGEKFVYSPPIISEKKGVVL